MTARESWTAYAAALWALIFAVLHVVWAMGWYVGLDPVLSREAFQQRWFLIYDLVVAGLCGLAVWVALALVQPWGARRPRALVGGLAWCSSAVLVLRGGAGAAQTAYVAATGQNAFVVYRLWEVWFCMGAALFTVSTWRYWRMPRVIVTAAQHEEVPLNWNDWVRQIHRWLSIAFTVAVIVTFIALAQKEPVAWVSYLPLPPLALLLFTGLYLFVLPHVSKWRSGRGPD